MNEPPPEALSLTDEQSRPLAVRGSSVALSSGAGCGKTTVLTSRFLRDLEGPGGRPLGSIVALTFTEKAARELRKRIRDKCRDKLGRGDDPTHWRSILRGLEAAPIGTFHEFCARVLRRFALEAGIDPEFTVVEESVALSIRSEAVARSLREWLSAGDPDLVELATEFGLESVRQSLLDLIAHRAVGELEVWRGRSAEELVGLWKGAWETRGREARLSAVAKSSRACLSLLSAHESSHEVMRERCGFLLENLPRLEHGAASDEWIDAIHENAKVQGGGTKKHWSSPEIHEEVGSAFKKLREEIKGFLKRCQWDHQVSLEAAEHGLRFTRLALRAREAYDSAKRERGALDFDDLLRQTRDLLRDGASSVRSGLDRSTALLLVDEFQDTDPMQGEILERLAGDGLGAGRLFLVGDSKQSIYRFRGAQPRIFQEFRGKFPDEGRKALTENFRSVPGILDFVNALFAETFTEPEAALAPGPATPARGEQPAIEFLWASDPGEGKGATVSVHERRTSEAVWLARRLRQRLDAVWTVRDPRTKEPRPAKAGDVALLFRAMTDVAPYEVALAAEGLDYHVVGGSAFYAQQEVHDLINLLAAIEDPFDAVSLAGALRSPFFCLSDDGLYWLATSRRRDLAAGLHHCDEIPELSPTDRSRAQRARLLLTRWRGFKDHLPIACLLDRILDESGYEAALLGEFLGARKRANVRKLVRLARRFDGQGGFTLGDLVARLRDDLRRPPREEQAATTDEEGDFVRLMSIHQSKGLEFPIVVIPDLNRDSGSSFQGVVFHPELGPLVRPPRDREPDPGAAEGPDGSDEQGQSLGWQTYGALEALEEKDEALRLFYVAATRARDSLIMSAGMGPAEKPKSPAMTLLDERFDRRSGLCRSALPEGWVAPAIQVTLECPARTAPIAAGRRNRPRPRLRAIAGMIERSTVRPAVDPKPERIRPRFVDLDPALSLPPPSARLDRLVRAILSDPRAFEPRHLASVAARAGQRQDPVAPARRIAEAVERLTPWLAGPLAQELARSTALERAIQWTVAWPPDSSEPTVFRGQMDFLARDRLGEGRVVVLSDPAASDPAERLRLLLSAHAGNAMGLGPVRQGWWVRLGPGGTLRGEERFDPAAIEEAIEALWASGTSRPLP